MPIYEYICTECRSSFEKLVSAATCRVACDACGSDRVEKQWSTFSAGLNSARLPPCSTGSCQYNPREIAGCGDGHCPCA